MPVSRLVLLPLVLLASTVAVRAEPDDVPVVGRPVDLPFSEASGWFEVKARAEPTTLQAESPLTFTLSVRAVRPVRRPPQRLDLRQLPNFVETFYIEDIGAEATRPDDRTWDFSYRLKPRRVAVHDIPSVPFVYFNPYLLTAGKGFQVLYTDPIPLHVLPQETVHVPVQGPENAFLLSTGPSLLERQTPWTTPRLDTLLFLLLTPPIGCLIWYLIWQRLYPDAARLARQHRSRAARQALHALHTARRFDSETRAARTANIVADYLHKRFDLNVAEPTPREVAALFAQSGFSSALAEQGAHFFEMCDLARFLPASSPSSAELQDAAVRFILAVESAEEARKKRLHRIPVLVVLSPVLLVASGPATLSDREILERAETEFQEGVHLRQSREQARPHFLNAVSYFEELEQRGVRNALLYRNLGNAYLLADDLPHALLAYHRGLRLSPNDRTLRESLAEARERVVYPASGDLGRPRREERPPWLPYIRSEWLMFAAFVAYVAGCVGPTRWRMVRRGRWLVGGLLALLLAGLLSSWVLNRVQEQHECEVHPLVVIARDGMILRRGNGMIFPPRYDTPLNRGVEGRLLFERDGWMQIELSGDEIGWVSREGLVVDIPQ
jgi:tetratricopeptide (TPR) repeat protein